MSHSPHGSVAGFADGCRSVGGCPNRGTTQLTCVEAATRHRSDFETSRLAPDQPLPRWLSPGEDPKPATIPEDTPVREATHGTAWGYRRGCRNERACPHWGAGKITCSQARRRYLDQYRAQRLRGAGKPVDHGSARGALTGCTDEAECPRGENDLTCMEARRRSRMDRARRQGVRPRTEPVDATALLPIVSDFRAHGWSLRRIAGAAGCGVETIRRLVNAATGASDDSHPRVRVLPRISEALQQLAQRSTLPTDAGD